MYEGASQMMILGYSLFTHQRPPGGRIDCLRVPESVCIEVIWT